MKTFWKNVYNLGNIDCEVRLDVLTDVQIANLCRPNRIGKPPRNKRLNLQPVDEIQQPNQSQITNDAVVNVNSANFVTTPEPVAFVTVEADEGKLLTEK